MNNNLRPWQAGVSGNPKGRPIGAKSWRTVVKDLLADTELLDTLEANGVVHIKQRYGCKNASELIAVSQIIKAINGDAKAADWLLKMNGPQMDTIEQISPPTALVRFI